MKIGKHDMGDKIKIKDGWIKINGWITIKWLEKLLSQVEAKDKEPGDGPPDEPED